ncbi:MAG: APC family permease, partial [Actinomycetes bacterium]
LAFAGDYLKPFLDVPATPTALAFLLLIALLNARGMKESVRANVLMTVIEVSGLVLVIVLVAVMFGRGDGDASRALAFNPEVSPAAGVLAASLLAYYSFVGFETSANVAEEVRDVHRVYPKALFGALLTAGGIYILIGLASATALTPEALSSSSGPLLQVVQATGVGVPDWLFGLIALIAVANGALLTMIMASRLAFGMAEQSLLPATLGRVLPRRRTPWAAILVTTIAAAALTATGDLGSLAETVVLLLLFVFISTNTAVLVLRKDKVEHRHFRVPTLIPYLALASCVLLLFQQGPDIWLRAALLLAAGLVLYVVTRWSGRRFGSAAGQSLRGPEDPPTA